MNKKQPPYMSIKLAADKLNISEEELRYHVEEGDLIVSVPTPMFVSLYRPRGSRSPLMSTVLPPIFWKKDYLLVTTLVTDFGENFEPCVSKINSCYEYDQVKVDTASMEDFLGQSNEEAVEDFIKRRKKEGAKNYDIAYELSENYTLGGYAIAELLGLNMKGDPKQRACSGRIAKSRGKKRANLKA